MLRVQVCFRLTYYQGRAGLIGVDAVVGHSLASLGPSADKPVKKTKAKPIKRKLVPQKGVPAMPAQLAGTCKSNHNNQDTMLHTSQALAKKACISQVWHMCIMLHHVGQGQNEGSISLPQASFVEGLAGWSFKFSFV